MRSELVPVVHTFYTEMAHLQPGTEVLVIADSRTSPDIVELFVGQARALGAIVQALLVPTPPPASVQPSTEWSKTIQAATTTPDLIVDMSVGYAEMMVQAIERGARIISPGDGTGHEQLAEVLLRTVADVDIHALRREADALAALFTAASTCRIVSKAGTDLEADISGLNGIPADGFLWDPDRNDWKATWALLPPAQPGVFLPKGRVNGTIACDGFLLWEPMDIQFPREPVRMTVSEGFIVEITGDPWFTPRLSEWLDRCDTGDRSPFHGPVHINIGTNPRAQLTQHQEFERLRGTVTFGFGDNSMLNRLVDEPVPVMYSPLHWDAMILMPTLYLDDKQIIQDGVLQAL